MKSSSKERSNTVKVALREDLSTQFESASKRIVKEKAVEITVKAVSKKAAARQSKDTAEAALKRSTVNSA